MRKHLPLTLLIVALFFTFSQVISVGHPDKHLKALLRNSVVYIVNESEKGGGTGFLVKNDNGREYIITNRHVCRGTIQSDGSVKVKTDEKVIKRKVIEISTESDLCIIESGFDQKALKMADEYELESEAYVMGHPYLNPLTFVHGELIADVTIGLIDHPMTAEDNECSGEGQHAEKINMLFFTVEVCIQDYKSISTTIPTFPGNSGSPMVNEKGEVIGVIFAGDTSSNWGYAVPLDQLKAFINKY